MSMSYWSQASLSWSQESKTWTDVASSSFVENVIYDPGVDATVIVQPWLVQPWNPYRANDNSKRLIKLICKVEGKVYEQEKKLGSMDVDVNDVKMVVKPLKIDLEVKPIGK